MSSCTSCGHESASMARFCPECGLPLVSPEAVGAEVITGTDKSHWLTMTDPPDGGAVRNPVLKRGTKHPLAVVAAGLVLALVVWNLFRAPTAEVAGLAGGLAISPTSMPSALLGADDSVEADEEAASTSTTARLDGDRVDVSALDPALTGYHLFAQQSRRLLRVDLADGTVDDHEVSGRLLGVFNGRLILIGPDAAITALPLDDPEAEPVSITAPGETGHELVVAVLTTEGVAHVTTGVFSPDRAQLSMIRVDLLTGSEQRVDVAQYGAFGLVEVPGAGLFELTGDGFRPLVDGSPRFYGERLTVIEECDTPDRCRRFWLDRVTGGEVDRPVPEESTGWLLGSDGRIAVSFGPRGRVFIDTETGETLSELAGFDVGNSLSLPDDLTPDERFLATVDSAAEGDTEIHDLLTGDSWSLELPRTFNLSKVLFVPKETGE